MEPAKEETAVSFGIDGVVESVAGFSRSTGDAVIHIFKRLADLDSNEKRKPQNGSFCVRVDEQHRVEFRVTTSGTVAGEKLLLRVLDRERDILTLAQLGMPEAMQRMVHEIVTRPHGLFLVAGPSEAGKSTTLHACLGEIDRYQMSVISLGNEVGHRIDNVTHIAINPKEGKTYASEMPAILRQGPDVLCVDEIRDGETATFACETAKTGPLMLASLDAEDAVSALGVLIEMGVNPSLLGKTLSAIICQRLVRVLCPDCKVRYKPDTDMLYKANLHADRIKYFFRPPEPTEMQAREGQEPAVCDHCSGSGYHGRTGIFELLIVTDRIRELIHDNLNLNTIKQEAVKNGLKPLQEAGLQAVIDGVTSIEELLRLRSG
jgi:type II secretory ATPase GspE/PulE/Tfp pilus assembly ATPase PilB-like protein